MNVGMVLEQYPVETIQYVTDPRTGVQSRHDWPPSIKAVVDACDSRMRHKAMQHRFANWGKNDDMVLLTAPPPAERPTAEQLKARFGPNYGLKLPGGDPSAVKDWTGQAPSWSAIAERYRANPAMAARLMEPRILPRASDDAEGER